MLVEQLVELLLKQNQKAEVSVAVGWAKDTAISDDGEALQVEACKEGKGVQISGWLSNCGTELEIGDEG